MFLSISNKADYLFRRLRGILYTGSISKKVCIGKNCRIRGVEHISWGTEVWIDDNCWIEAISHYHGDSFVPKIIFGDKSVVGRNSILTCIESLIIGDNVLMGPNVLISDHYHGYGREQWNSHIPKIKLPLISFGGVKVGANVWIGANTVILRSTSIEDNVVVPAASKLFK